MLAVQTSINAEAAWLRILLDHLPNSAAALFDDSLCIVCAGGELLADFNFDSTITGRRIPELFSPVAAEMISRWLMSALQGQTVRTNWTYRERLLNITIQPVSHPVTGMPLGLIMVQDMQSLWAASLAWMRDERERAETAKNHEIAQSRAHLIERILHEFRNPLAAAASSAEILEQYGDGMTDERRKLHVTRVGEEIHRLSEILDNILGLFT